MKILKQGTQVRWWHGLKVECLTCGREVRLEPGDEKDTDVLRIRGNQIRLACLGCHAWVVSGPAGKAQLET